MIAIFEFLKGIPRWMWEGLAILLLAAALYFTGAYQEKVRIETRTLKQEVRIEHQVLVTGQSNEAENTATRGYRAEHPLTADSLCNFRLPPRATEGPPSTGPASVLEVHPSNSGGAVTDADRLGLLDALAGRADEVSAELRRRQSLEP